MSRTTEILLYVAATDEHHVEDLTFWLRDFAPRSDDRVTGSPGHLLPLTGEVGGEAWGGYKATSAIIWAGVANYLDVGSFVDHVGGVPWGEPDSVQLLVRDEGDPWFRLFMIRGGGLRQYCPAPPADEQDRPW